MARDGSSLIGLKRVRKQSHEPLIGAAIGIGMTAESAEDGGADFLLALNAGRYRVMGAASVSAMLPLADSNRMTLRFATREILGRVKVPVFFGACAFDPALDLKAFVHEIAASGFHGIANFPTSIHYDGRFRQALDEAGLGYAREVQMLEAAGAAGLMRLGYAKSPEEVDLLLASKVEVICLNFGWNAGGARGHQQDFSLEQVIDFTRRIFARIRQRCEDTICVVEGGPIVSPEHMYEVVKGARGDGYVGGSTLDRLPLETSVTQMTSAFRTIGLLRDAAGQQAFEAERISRISGLVGRSGPMRALFEKVGRLARTAIPITVEGEPGVGKTALARAIHPLSGRKGPLIRLDAAELQHDLEANLFGVEASAGTARRAGALETHDATVVVEHLDALSASLQIRLLDYFDRGVYMRIGGSAEIPARARFVGIIRGTSESGGLAAELMHRLQPGRVRLPSLRERPDDLPLNVRAILDALGSAQRHRRLELTSEGYRLLFSREWPLNLRELRSVLEQAVASANGDEITAADLASALPSQNSGNPDTEGQDERRWLLEGLRRNRFRRGQTAAFLGISRKTLYNKMKAHGLHDRPRDHADTT